MKYILMPLDGELIGLDWDWDWTDQWCILCSTPLSCTITTTFFLVLRTWYESSIQYIIVGGAYNGGSKQVGNE